jgi:hypothetical protein
MSAPGLVADGSATVQHLDTVATDTLASRVPPSIDHSPQTNVHRLTEGSERAGRETAQLLVDLLPYSPKM